MGLDHSNAFVRVWFDGLISFCFTRRGGGQCEMGMVQADDHVGNLIITRINPNGTKTEILNRELEPGDDVKIEAENPVEEGVYTFPRSLRDAPFDGPTDVGDPEDFRWIVDLQGSLFHGNKLKFKGGSGKSLLRPRITIPHATFYTSDKSPDKYLRIKRVNDTATQPIGKIADRLGADIVCDVKGGRVKVGIGSKPPFTLFRDTVFGKGFRYWIEITNLCRLDDTTGPTCSGNSDFIQYYLATQDDDGTEFDLEVVYPPGDPRGINPIEDSPGFEGFRSNGAPQVCNVTFMGESSSLP